MNVGTNATAFRLTAIMFAAIIAFTALPTLLAEDAVPAPAPAATGNSVTNLLRDPFWPVGYWPQPKVVAATNGQTVSSVERGSQQQQPPPPPPPEPPPKWPDLRVRGIMKMPSGRHEAIIEGVKGVVTSGQTVSKTDGKYEFSWKINTVSATRVDYTRLDVRKIK